MEPNWIKVLCVDGRYDPNWIGPKTGEICEGRIIKRFCHCSDHWFIKGFSENLAHNEGGWLCPKCGWSTKSKHIPITYRLSRFIPLEDSALEAELRESLTLQTT